MPPYHYRPAGSEDAERIARLHADSWRRHYRGAYSDAFLDGDLVAERRAVWSERLARPAGTATVLAEDASAPADGPLAGFVHVVFDDDPKWGSLVDNLHVDSGHRRLGLGTALLARAAAAVLDGASSPGLYLWVLAQNTAARHFYEAVGGVRAETLPITEGLERLVPEPVHKIRMTWPEASTLLAADPAARA